MLRRRNGTFGETSRLMFVVTQGRAQQLLFAIFLGLTFLESYTLGPVTFSKIAVAPLLILSLMSGVTRCQIISCVMAMIYLGSATLISSAQGQDFDDSLKSAMGALTFLLTIILLPKVIIGLRRCNTANPGCIILILFIYSTAFLFDMIFEYTRSYGSVEGSFENWRPFGISSEPSWLAITIFSLGSLLFAHVQKTWIIIITFAILILSRSSIGLILSGLIMGQFVVAASTSYAEKIRRATFLILSLSVASIIWHDELVSMIGPYIQKIINPTAFGSGVSRFVEPQSFIYAVWSDSPIFGMGFTYFENNVQGYASAAILFLPVFWELGLIGILAYSVVIAIQLGKHRPDYMSIAGILIICMSAGLPYTTFQAASIVLIAMQKPIRRSAALPQPQGQ